MRNILPALIIVILAGCSAPPMVTPKATSIQPTNIPITTSTSVSTVPPISTDTPMPTMDIPTTTSSPTPTRAPTPTVPLRKVLITISDFATLSDFYGANPILIDKNNVAPIMLDSSKETFIAKDSDNGKVEISLIRYKKATDAKDINDGMKSAFTMFDKTFSVTQPDNFWVGSDLVGEVWASATHNDVLIQVVIDHSVSVEPESLASFALMLIKNQVLRLIDGGY